MGIPHQTARCALACLAAILWVLFFKEGFYDLYEMIPGFAVGFGVTIAVSLATTPPEARDHRRPAERAPRATSRPARRR